jgi:hypothetical protein
MITQTIRDETKTKHGHMSDAAVQKFRNQKEQDKISTIAGERFKNALSFVVTTPDNLRKLILRCDSGGPLDRRVHKLSWWIDAGYALGREIDSVYLIGFFSRIVPEELKMSDKTFAGAWDAESAKRLRAARIRREVIPADEKTRKPRAPRRSLEYMQAQMAKRHCQHETVEITTPLTC